MLNTPVLFLVFNRPDTTRKVFETIRQIKPKQLFIAADGPRLFKPDDLEKCQKVRKIIEEIDWICEVKTLLREENLGCKYAVSQAITWFFENVEQGIILEDDTLPNESFFLFCENLLEKYKYDSQIMHLSGSRLIPVSENKTACHFSKYPHIWGWATWRRAWQHYDTEILKWNKCKRELVENRTFVSKKEEKVWSDFFDAMKAQKVDTWDTQWHLAIWLEKGLCITPPLNLVSNIGLGLAEATHTQTQDDSLSLSTEFLDLESLQLPDKQEVNIKADVYLFENFYYQWRIKFSWKQFLHDHVYRFFPNSFKNFYRSLK